MKYSPTHIATYLANKEKVLYLAVLSGAVLLITLGVWIENRITESAEQTARMYQTSIRATDDNQLNYSIDTKQGRILAQVTVKPADLVKFPEMHREFAKVTKTKERYTQHYRTVCETHYRMESRTRTYTDSNGNMRTQTYTEQVPYQVCRQETYYSWDRIDSWEESAKHVEMAGRKYPISLFFLRMSSIDAKDIIKGEDDEYVYEENKKLLDLEWGANEGDVRYSYDVLELPKSGTVFLNVSEGVRPVFGDKIELHGENPEELVKSAQKKAETHGNIFKVVWGIFTVSMTAGGLYAVWRYEE